MKTRTLGVFLQTLLLLLCVAAFTRAQGRIVEPADIIVVHGHVYTENPKQPWAQAVAIYRGKIVAVGDDPEIERRRGMGTKVINELRLDLSTEHVQDEYDKYMRGFFGFE